MTDQEIKKAFTIFTQETADKQKNVKDRIMEQLPHKVKRPVWMYKTAVAAAVVVLVFTFFAYTPPGVAYADYIYKNVIQKFFPPKEIKLRIEGMKEESTHSPHGTVSEQRGLSSYVIYFDESIYAMSKANGVDVISPLNIGSYTREEILKDMGHLWKGLSQSQINQKIKDEMARRKRIRDKLPDCKMEIKQIAGITPGKAAEEELKKLKKIYSNVSKIEEAKVIKGLTIHAASGAKWDSPIMDRYIVDNQKGGVFMITIQTYLEASEGHGARLHKALSTFKVFV